jgi:glycosyltransferase involved in cell wall biosynthesis
MDMDEKNEPTERPLVSIIVPIYNTEEYLEECLDCLVNQTLQNIEIICINDATEDNSMEIVQKFAKNSNKIKIIENEVNKGLSATRNIGIGSVNGEYISFFDSDDIIEKTAFEKLYNEAKEHDQDVIVYNIKRFNDEGEEWFEILQKNPIFPNMQKRPTC